MKPVKGKISGFNNAVTDQVITAVPSSTEVTVGVAYTSESFTAGEATISHDMLVGRVQVTNTENANKNDTGNLGWSLSGGNAGNYKITTDAKGTDSLARSDADDSLLTAYLHLKSSNVAQRTAYALPTLSFTEQIDATDTGVNGTFNSDLGSFTQIFRYYKMEIAGIREVNAEENGDQTIAVKDGTWYSTDETSFNATGFQVELQTRFGLGLYDVTADFTDGAPTNGSETTGTGGITIDSDDYYNYDDGLTYVWSSTGAYLKGDGSYALSDPSNGSSGFNNLGTFTATLISSNVDTSVDGSGASYITHAVGSGVSQVPTSAEDLLVWNDLEVVGTASTEGYVHLDITLDDGQVALPHANYVKIGRAHV